MLLVLASSGLGLLALPGVFRPLGRRMPKEWARSSVLAPVSGIVIVASVFVVSNSPRLRRFTPRTADRPVLAPSPSALTATAPVG